MGVTGLWKLIEPCGKPVPVETLEGKILAIDISIWLHQVVKGFQDSKGSALNNAHLLGLFHRLCKLLYYRVRPVFIFDGCVPQLKRDTIARRQQQRNKLSNEADRIQALLLQSLAKEKVVQQALGSNAELLLKSPVKTAKSSKPDEDDLFKLPELPAAQQQQDESDSQDDYTSATSDSSFDESTARYAYNASLQGIDVRSQHFRSLPADVRHEILTDIKETRKQSSWGRLHELPARSDDFASFQMKRLLKRRAVQESLEQAQQEMGGHTLTYSELCDFFNEEGIVTPTAIEQNTRQISSDEHTRFLLVRDLKKKAMESSKEEKSVKCETIKEESFADDKALDDQKPCTSAQAVAAKKSPDVSEEKQKAEEYDADLALALALSLEQSKVYDEKDYDYDSDQDLRLNRAQSKQLRHAAKGPARSYMIEYGGMNVDEVENIMEVTQLNDTQSLERHFTDANTTTIEEDPELLTAIKESIEESKLKEETKVYAIDTDTDSDLEEVVNENPSCSQQVKQLSKGLEICVNIKEQLKPSDDIFADIFEESSIDKKDTEIKQSEEVETAAIIQAKESEEEGESDDDFIEVQESEELLTEDNIMEKVNEEEKVKLHEAKVEESEESNVTKRDTPTIEEKAKPAAVLSSILADLKRQTDEVKNIKLESIKLSDSAIIELSSDDEASKTIKTPKTDTKSEIIELCDSDDNAKERTTPNKTPTKNKSITEYFETSYVIKRTPDKTATDAITPPTTPKVQKPFYVKRTPKSGRKRAADEAHSDEDTSSPNKQPKVAKTLFEQGAKEQEEPKPIDTAELIKDAATVLQSQKTNEELQTMANDLAVERRELEVERNRQDRMGMSISQRMSIDCQELLRLFGIPYIVAPMEAEAQCAFLNAIELTHGTITDDSDIWLFGGRTVYKNFFAQNKHVLEFRAEQIEQTFNCNRDKLIQLACLVGSDYTTGIHGIGAVTALEILASFSAGATATVEAAAASNSMQVLSTLINFRDWWQAHRHAAAPPGSSARHALRKKLKNIELHEGFPSTAVIDAYLTPKVDENRDAFSWGLPDVESIREFARKTFGWTTSKTDDILMPVMKKINDKKIQGSIRNYFAAKSAIRVHQPKVSKRVQTAIDKMSGKIDAETPEKPKRPARPKRNKAPAEQTAEGEQSVVKTKRAKRKAPAVAESTDEAPMEPTTSAATSKPPKSARIPNTKEVIPQRERDLEQMRLNKIKAAEIMKKATNSK